MILLTIPYLTRQTFFQMHTLKTSNEIVMHPKSKKDSLEWECESKSTTRNSYDKNK